jgi:hypothetical protein
VPNRSWTPEEEILPASWQISPSSEDTVAGVVGPFDAYVRLPSLPDYDHLRVLSRSLTSHTTTPESCWFAAWEGYGLQAQAISGSPRLALGDKRYFLFRGTSDDLVGLSQFLATAGLDETTAEVAINRGAVHVPNMWWPEDRAWTSGWHVDAAYLLIGGEEALIHDLLDIKAIRAARARGSDQLDMG